MLPTVRTLVLSPTRLCRFPAMASVRISDGMQPPAATSWNFLVYCISFRGLVAAGRQPRRSGALSAETERAALSTSVSVLRLPADRSSRDRLSHGDATA